MMRGLNNKVAVIAGGAGGIGSATSRRLAQEGAAVVIADLDAEDAGRVARDIVDAGGRALAVDLEISSEDSVAAMFDAAVTRFGGVDAVHVNAADLSRKFGPDTDVVDVDLRVFDHTLAVNLRGHVLVTRAAIPLLLDRGGGAIVYTSSAAAFAGEPTRVTYGITKAGINALVRHVASRFGKSGIRANAVAPGFVVTERIAANFDDRFMEFALDRNRHTRLGRPEDIAAMVAFLVSDDGEWITGQVLGVDGGTQLR
jgi:NAD(P)-dependent dehydrogenase (short-subunit alcohol dehydrogenase family)